MNLDLAIGRPPLVLLVDPSVASRHWMWRALSRCGVLEASSASGARDWIDRRPDIDALVVEDHLPDGRGVDLVRHLVTARHGAASRSIVLARPSPDWVRIAQAGATLVERGDLRSVLSKLAGWFLARDASVAKALLREADRLRA
jgi:CheY-like chemotaxis protein